MYSPRGKYGCLAPGQLVEAQPSNLAGHRAGRAGTDCAAIDLDHGHDLGCRTGEETFVGDVYVVFGQRRFKRNDAGLAGQVDDYVAGNAFQNAGIARRSRWASRPWRTMKMLSPVHSATSPLQFSIRASMQPACTPSIFANMLFK